VKPGYKISAEVRQQILGGIKNNVVSVATATKEHGMSDATIYNLLTKGVKGQPTLLEVVRLKKEEESPARAIGGNDPQTLRDPKKR
jgi:lambda repressor-like predicted transcriptional regulator